MTRDAPHPGSTRVPLLRHTADAPPAPADDLVAVEEPLELRVEGHALAVIMRTPGDDEELAAGFLLTEGVAKERGDLFEINRCPSVSGEAGGNIIDVLLRRPESVDLQRLTRHVFSASSCGICGKASIESVHQHFAPLPTRSPDAWPTAPVLQRLPDEMARGQTTFRATGGLHAAAIFRCDGTLVHLREDVGRHNAVDKVLGRALLDGATPLDDHILFVSGRVSFEIVQKALAARVPVVAGISAPTSLAIEFARANGQMLAGFVRAGRMNVYAGPGL